MIREFMLEKILPNPYQTREGEDAEHVANLADSIAQQGMLQIPSARIAPGQQGRDALNGPLVQLVFGHSRLAAFKFLRDGGVSGFSSMPLNLVEMSDEEMFQAAVAENRERKDLTPIEEAKAMLVYRDQFRKNSEEIGKLFHLSDSAVRNKLRLLDLPSEVQVKVGRTVSESAARDILVFLSLPAAVREEETWSVGGRQSFDNLFKNMLEGEVSAEDLKELVDDTVRRGARMDRKEWKHTDELVGEGIIGVCKGCANLITRDGVEYCMQDSCFEAKEKAHRRQYLSQASLLSGIAILEDGKEGYGGHTGFDYGNEAALEEIRARRCENLRLRYDDGYSGGEGTREAAKITHLVAEGFPHASIVCGKRGGNCTCLKAKREGVAVEGGSEEELKAARQEMLRQRRYEEELIKQMVSTAAAKIARGLGELNFEAWKAVLEKITYDGKFKDAETIGALFAAACDLAVQRTYWGGRESVLMQLNELLVRCGLEELDISFGDGDEQGKPLMEVFAGEGDNVG
jgi:ParB/RepB/Spo0J family partition protein